MKQKILILYTSVGLGHKYIAKNIEYHLSEAGYGTKMHDVFKLEEGLLVDLGVKLHQFVNTKMPWLWRWLYMSETFSYFTLPLRVPLAAKNSKNIQRVIEDYKPDMVITTQTSASAALAYLKRRKIYQNKFVIAFSDFHLHKYWLYDEADHYLVNTPDQETEMKLLGVPQDKISVCGITLIPGKNNIDKEIVLEKLGLKKTDKIILMGSGSLGTGFDLKFVKRFARYLYTKDQNYKLVIVTGKNKSVYDLLSNQKLQNVVPLAFYETMQELYLVSGLFLTKPGGLTIAESLHCRLPVFINHWLPGQEELNYNYLLKNHIVVNKPVNLTGDDFLFETIVSCFGQAIPENNRAIKLITQQGREGKVLVSTINKVFHGV